MKAFVLVALVSFAGCAPRRQVYTPPTPTPAPTPAPNPTPLPSAPEVAVGPALTPAGLVFPPEWGLPPIAAPGGFGLPVPSAFPFPMPGTTATAAPTATATPVPTATATTPPPAPPPGPPPATDSWPASWATLEDQVLVEVNIRRSAGATCGTKSFGPAGPLTMNAQLRAAARGHSQDMATKNYFDHTSLDGRHFGDRIKAAGYEGGTYSGENIAAGNAGASATVTQWMNSPGHCENVMDNKYKWIGVGYASSAGSKYKHYWTQNFGGP